MIRALLLLSAAALAAAAPPPPPANPAPGEIVAAAPASDWIDIPAGDLLVMTLAPDAMGHARRVVIQLMPPPFSQGWIANIRTLAGAHWWDGTSINRVQDNYVVQWGDPNGDDKARAKPLPPGLAVVPESEYTNGAWSFPTRAAPTDPYNDDVKIQHGWPTASDGRVAWPVHCYGMVGVGRDLPPDTGSGAELYVVIGTPPRHLDRNIALVGRVVDGIENLSSLPRGTEALGFYRTAAERVPIVSIRLASALPAAERPRFQYLSTKSASFARYADARANRTDAFFVRPAGGADICNVPVPVRSAR